MYALAWLELCLLASVGEANWMLLSTEVILARNAENDKSMYAASFKRK